MTAEEHHDVNRKLRILNHAKESGNVSKMCRYFGISHEIFYPMRSGERTLINSKRCPENPKPRTPLEIKEKILYLRRTYHY